MQQLELHPWWPPRSGSSYVTFLTLASEPILTESSSLLNTYSTPFLCFLSPSALSGQWNLTLRLRLKWALPRFMGTSVASTRLFPWHPAPGSVWLVREGMWALTQSLHVAFCISLTHKSGFLWMVSTLSLSTGKLTGALHIILAHTSPCFEVGWLPHSPSLRLVSMHGQIYIECCHCLVWPLAKALCCLQPRVLGCG